MSPDIQETQSSRPQRKKSAASLFIPKHLKMVKENEMKTSTMNNNNIVSKNSFTSKNKTLIRKAQKQQPQLKESKKDLACKGHAKSTRVRRIQGSNGFYLEVLCEGLIRGTLNGSSEYGVFHMFSVGPNKTVVRNIMTGLHLAIEGGHLLTKEIPDECCIFDETLLDRFLVSYQVADTRGKTHSISITNKGVVSAAPLSQRSKDSSMLFKTLLLTPKDFEYYFSLANSLDYCM